MTKNKKIIQIKTGEYLYKLLTNNGIINSVQSTYNEDMALDISDMSLEQVGYLVDNFKRVGYTKVEILTIKPEVKEEVEENTFDTASKIDKALGEVKERVDDEI